MRIAALYIVAGVLFALAFVQSWRQANIADRKERAMRKTNRHY